MRYVALLLLIGSLAACDLAADGSTQRPTGDVLYVVKEGETLFRIADQAYGNGLLWNRIWEANPWVREPHELEAGVTIRIPAYNDKWGDPPPREEYAPQSKPGQNMHSANPGGGGGGDVSIAKDSYNLVRNIATQVASKTLFGMPVQNSLLVGFCGTCIHAILQGLLVWLAANLTFVKEASFKRAMKAVFLTEMLTFLTIVTVAGLGVLMLYLGTAPADLAGESRLFPTLEGYLATKSGVAVATGAVMILYLVLALRFLPSVLKVQTGRAVPVLALAVVIPHLAGLYLLGQRFGWV